MSCPWPNVFFSSLLSDQTESCSFVPIFISSASPPSSGKSISEESASEPLQLYKFNQWCCHDKMLYGAWDHYFAGFEASSGLLAPCSFKTSVLIFFDQIPSNLFASCSLNAWSLLIFFKFPSFSSWKTPGPQGHPVTPTVAALLKRLTMGATSTKHRLSKEHCLHCSAAPLLLKAETIRNSSTELSQPNAFQASHQRLGSLSEVLVLHKAL